jgi:hypothetical protein
VARGWWAGKIGRTGKYVRAAVSTRERESLAGLLEPAQLALFDGMHLADRRHGLDVVAHLERRGIVDRDLLIAGLLHDCGKGPRVRLVHRVAWSLGQRYGRWIWSASEVLPTLRRGLASMRGHAERSAELARRAGCTGRTVELIRHQESPLDADGLMLLEADESN